VWAAVKTGFAAAVNAIRAGVAKVVAGWNAVVGALARFIQWVVAGWNTLKTATTNALGQLVAYVKTTTERMLIPFKVLFTALGTIVVLGWMAIRKVTSVVWGTIWGQVIKPIWEAIKRGFAVAQAWLQGKWTAFLGALRRGVQVIFGPVAALVGSILARIRSAFSTAMAWIRSAWASFWNALRTGASAIFNAIYNTVIAPVWNRIRTAFSTGVTVIRNVMSRLWTDLRNGARIGMDALKRGIDVVLGRIRDAFRTAKENIGRVWAGVKDVVSTPINWVKNNVYNKPLVPVWNRVAELVNGPKLRAYAKGGIAEAESYANGGTPFGVRPGYTPGRDTHQINVGGGEAIMRPEWTRAVGPALIHMWNRIARTKGVAAVRKALVRGMVNQKNRGVEGGSFEEGQGFAGGGVVDWIKDKIGGAAGVVKGLAGKLKDWAIGGLKAAASKILSPITSALTRNLSTSPAARTVGDIGKKAISSVLDKIGSSDEAAVAKAAVDSGGGDPGGPAMGGGRNRVTWKGGTFTERFRNTLIRAQRLAGVGIPVYQGGFSRRVAASGTSHYGDAIDTVWNSRILSGLRRARVAAWHRTPAQGFIHHIHGVPLPGAGFPGGSGIWQAQDYLRGGNGLALGGIVQRVLGDHIKPISLESGGLVRGGRGGTLAHIGEGSRDELVTPLPRHWRDGGGSNASIDRLCRLIEAYGLQGATVTFGDILVPAGGSVAQEVNRELQLAANVGLV
jgi:hypothetical protein